MPAIVRHALENIVGANLKVYGMLYLPDAMVGAMGDTQSKRAMANGYAALKEINYYQGMSVRPGYSAKFPFNDPTCPEIEIMKYFDEPMLIGNSMGAVAEADKLAQQTVAEYLLNLFTDNTPQTGAGLSADMTLQSVLHNATGGRFLYHPASNETKEMTGEAHDFPYQFGTIGFAKAAAPQKIIIAYAVNRICKLAGIKAEDTVIKEQMGNGILPFRRNLFNATEGTLQSRQLIQPLAGLLDKIHNGSFNFAAELNEGQAAEWRKIKAGEYEVCKNSVIRKVDNATTIVAMDALKEEIDAMYQQYMQGVNAFVKQYGPLAYVNVYQGNFIKEGDRIGTGIKEMLNNLMCGCTIDGTSYTGFKSSEETKKELERIEQVIRNTSRLIDIRGDKVAQAGTWMNNYNKWVKSQIDEKRRAVAIGTNKYVDECICKKAAILADQMEKFGHLLNELAEIYQGFGKSVEIGRASCRERV